MLKREFKRKDREREGERERWGESEPKLCTTHIPHPPTNTDSTHKERWQRECV